MMPWFLFHTNYSLITKLMDVQSKKKKKKLQASIIDLQDVFVFISVTQIKVITFAM